MQEGSAFWWEVERQNSARRWALMDTFRLEEEKEIKKTAQLQEILDSLLAEISALVDQYRSHYGPVRTTFQ